MAKEIQNKLQEQIMQLQVLQQRLQTFSSQLQEVQIEKLEIENALAEIKPTDKTVFKIFGSLMIEKSASEVKKNLKERKEELDIRVKSIEKQEKSTRQKIEQLQADLTAQLSKK